MSPEQGLPGEQSLVGAFDEEAALDAGAGAVAEEATGAGMTAAAVVVSVVATGAGLGLSTGAT